MAKKRKTQTAKPAEFSRSPFNSLKGFAASGEKEQAQKREATPVTDKPTDIYGSFADEMALLGVERLDPAAEESFASETEEVLSAAPEQARDETDEFLQALGEMDVCFSDRFPEEKKPPAASARRMKQLKQGKLVPEASLDLHGLQRAEVRDRISFFLTDARRQGWSTLLLITGKGLHSASGEAVLRDEAERFLAAEGRKAVAEWGRAPKQYGGDGALVLFLRKGEQG